MRDVRGWIRGRDAGTPLRSHLRQAHNEAVLPSTVDSGLERR